MTPTRNSLSLSLLLVGLAMLATAGVMHGVAPTARAQNPYPPGPQGVPATYTNAYCPAGGVTGCATCPAPPPGNACSSSPPAGYHTASCAFHAYFWRSCNVQSWDCGVYGPCAGGASTGTCVNAPEWCI